MPKTQTARSHKPSAEQLLASNWPFEFARAANGSEEEFDGSCPCCQIHGENFEVRVHCWRTGCEHDCEFSGIHVKGNLPEAQLQQIAEHIRDHNGWTNSTDWRITVEQA